LQAYSLDASAISSRSRSDIRSGGRTHRPKSDQRTQMSDPMAARQPFQPVGHADDSSVLHVTSTTRSETVLTAHSVGTTGSRLRRKWGVQ
jgi:hypothetical protein